MLGFIVSNLATILIGLAVLAIVLLVIGKMIRDHKKGKHSCSCGCPGCKGVNACHSMEK